jgi:hypothetical protein
MEVTTSQFGGLDLAYSLGLDEPSLRKEWIALAVLRLTAGLSPVKNATGSSFTLAQDAVDVKRTAPKQYPAGDGRRRLGSRIKHDGYRLIVRRDGSHSTPLHPQRRG